MPNAASRLPDAVQGFGFAAVAAVACLLGSILALMLFNRLRACKGGARFGWLCLAAIATGATIWIAHAVVLLGFRPGVSIGYDIAGTMLALGIGIAGSTLALVLAGWGRTDLGGIALGLAVAAVHFTGMGAVAVAAPMHRHIPSVAGAIVLACACGAFAFARAGRGTPGWRRTLEAAGLLALGIAGTHLLALGSIRIVPYPAAAVSDALGRSPAALAAAAVVVAGLVAVMTFVAYLLDRSARSEGDHRLRLLSNAAIEGIVLCEGDRVVDVNASFERLSGYARAQLQALSGIAAIIPSLRIGDKEGSLGEFLLYGKGGRRVPIEVIRQMDAQEWGRHVLAIRDLTERDAAAEHLRHLFRHDALTGLSNREGLLQRLVDLLRAPEGAPPRVLSLLLVDLDRFRKVNDMHGHEVGDAVLAELGSRLGAAVGAGGVAARIGHDVFAAAFVDADMDAAGLAERIAARLGEPVHCAGRTLTLTQSIGAVTAAATGDTAPETLVGRAETALDRAKSGADGRICVFRPGMDAEARRLHQLSEDLKTALETGGFEVHYQPQACLSTGRLIGMEALLRWNHPVHGPISPTVFIPIAESNGLIAAIGEWALRTACRCAAAWHPSITVAVNLSPVQFRHAGLVETVHQILMESGLPPRRLELEITESVLIDDHALALHILRRLKILGVSIALDDFGTGFSSLSTLRSFPFDKLKIDRSFLSEIDETSGEARLLASIIAIGRSLDLQIIAEGVETPTQCAYLGRASCDAAQGFWLERPKRIEDLRRHVEGGYTFEIESFASPLASIARDIRAMSEAAEAEDQEAGGSASRTLRLGRATGLARPNGRT